MITLLVYSSKHMPHLIMLQKIIKPDVDLLNISNDQEQFIDKMGHKRKAGTDINKRFVVKRVRRLKSNIYTKGTKLSQDT